MKADMTTCAHDVAAAKSRFFVRRSSQLRSIIKPWGRRLLKMVVPRRWWRPELKPGPDGGDIFEYQQC